LTIFHAAPFANTSSYKSQPARPRLAGRSFIAIASLRKLLLHVNQLPIHDKTHLSKKPTRFHGLSKPKTDETPYHLLLSDKPKYIYLLLPGEALGIVR
jgi:hypothetical protein